MIREMPAKGFNKVLRGTEIMEEVINGILIREVETRTMKSSLPVGGYSVHPMWAVHACKYCYASFMKRFTGVTEE